MSMQRLARACLAGAVLFVATSHAAAHPPDLPVDTKDVCVPCPDGGCCELNTRKPCETTSPMLCEIFSRFLQSFTSGFGGFPVIDLDLEFFCSSPESPAASGNAAETIDTGRRAHARKMYLIGERCRRSGDLDMAENCYRETKLLCPDCDYARKAEHRIRQVRALRTSEREDIGEEAEPAKEEALKEKGNYDYEVPPTCWTRTPALKETPMSGEKLLFETDFAKLSEAKSMYFVGERCRRGGDLKMAYRCYENAYRTCPQCRHGMKAQMRIQQIDARAREEGQKSRRSTREGTTELDAPFVSGDFLWTGRSRAQAKSPQQRAFVRIDQDGGYRNRYPEEPLPPAVNIEIIEEESRPMLEGDAEESDYPLSSSAQSEPTTLYIASAVRNLKLGENQEETTRDAGTPSCEDLSDWLPQAIRLMRGAGSLRIDAARLGRLMGRGEGAVQALGCGVVHECGRSFVVYPGRPR